MYKKKNRTPVIIAVVAVIVLIAAMIALQTYNARRSDENAEIETETESETEVQTETETPSHEILLYKNSAGEVSFDETWVVSDTDDEAVLSVEEDTLVTMMVTPNEGKQLDSVDVLDYDMHSISSVLRSATGTEGDNTREMRLSFVMPDCDIFVSFNFMDIEEELIEAEEEETDPTFGLVLHNVSAEVITSFNGQFDEEKFLNALGEALHVDSSRSEYRTVTDVYFGNLVENSTEKLSYEIYFNNDMLWKVLATYYPSEDSYVFTEIVDETDETASAGSSNLDTSSGTAGSSGSTGSTYESSGTAGSYASGTTVTTDSSSSTETTSFDIMSVSTVFLQFCGSEDAFYQSAFDYVLSKGLTGSIVGTMSDYEIDPDAQTATIHIMLNTGASMTGTYNKTNNTYSFSGL